ncbi:MAG: DUF2096 family protein [Candidatus Bathyarchaeia archaeon]
MAKWKILEQMITEFRKKGIAVPPGIISDLRSAKTLINVLKADPSRVETGEKIDELLMKVESYLIFEGQKFFGGVYMEEWLKRLDEAGKRPNEEEIEESRFITGISREHRWVRIKPTTDLSIDMLKRLAEESNLAYNMQNDGSILVYGKDEHIKMFIKKWRWSTK